MNKEELEKQDIRLNKLCFDYQEKEKRIADLEKENAELKSELTKKADTNHSLVEQMADLESENAELKEKNRQLNNEVEDLTAYCNQKGVNYV